MRNLIIRLFINAVALWAAAQVVGGIQLDGEFWAILLVAAVFGLVNALIKPILVLMTFPVVVLTLGLFTLVLNAFLLWLTAALVGALDVDGFLSAFLGALLVTVVSFLLSVLLPEPD